jgi:hypothetical protein
LPWRQPWYVSPPCNVACGTCLTWLLPGRWPPALFRRLRVFKASVVHRRLQLGEVLWPQHAIPRPLDDGRDLCGVHLPMLALLLDHRRGVDDAPALSTNVFELRGAAPLIAPMLVAVAGLRAHPAPIRSGLGGGGGSPAQRTCNSSTKPRFASSGCGAPLPGVASSTRCFRPSYPWPNALATRLPPWRAATSAAVAHSVSGIRPWLARLVRQRAMRVRSCSSSADVPAMRDMRPPGNPYGGPVTVTGGPQVSSRTRAGRTPRSGRSTAASSATTRTAGRTG